MVPSHVFFSLLGFALLELQELDALLQNGGLFLKLFFFEAEFLADFVDLDELLGGGLWLGRRSRRARGRCARGLEGKEECLRVIN